MTKQNESLHSRCGTAGSADVMGCRMSLYPMQNEYASQILTAIEQVDTSQVWSETDLFSTLYRGELESVVDCTRAMFIHACQSNVHLVSELTFSRGCPGDTEADNYLSSDPKAPNVSAKQKGHFPVSCKFSFYAFGDADYMAKIAEIVKLADERGLQPTSAHYVTLLEGTANQLFDYLEELLRYARQHIPHFVAEVTLSVNSPSLKKKEANEQGE